MSDSKDTAHDAANDEMRARAAASGQPRKIDPTLHTALEWVIEHNVSIDDAADWMHRNAPKHYKTVSAAAVALKAEL